MKINRQYFDIIKSKNYAYSKNEMGYYFDHDDKKFSIIKTGPYMQCFYNKRINDNWQLQSCSNHMTDINLCLNWIINKINEQ